MSEQLSINVGALLRDVGIQRTLEAEGDEWLDTALRALRTFSRLPEWSEFKTEDFRAWFIGEGYPAPHAHHCWGALTTVACKRGIIRWTERYVTSVSPKTHAHPVKLWAQA